MASINYGAKEISVKIVYYGPGLSGKTTNLQIIHQKVPRENKSNMVSLATETDRTLFFDFLPLDLGKIKGFTTKFQLYTVPGQVYYNATRKLVLRGVDGVVFVVDSQPSKVDDNLESFQNLLDNLAEYGYQIQNIPIVIQYNKRDVPDAVPIEHLQSLVNKNNYPWTEAVAIRGKGVFDTLKYIGKIVIDELNRKYSRSPSMPQRPSVAPAPRPMPAPAPMAPAPSAQARLRAPMPAAPQQPRFAPPPPQAVRPMQQTPPSQFRPVQQPVSPPPRPSQPQFQAPQQTMPRQPALQQPAAPRQAFPAARPKLEPVDPFLDGPAAQTPLQPPAQASSVPAHPARPAAGDMPGIDVFQSGARSAFPAEPQRQSSPPAQKGAGQVDYNTINIAPMGEEEHPARIGADDTATAFPEPAMPVNKSELDLEIERYQREIEERQQRGPAPAAAPAAPPAFPQPAQPEYAEGEVEAYQSPQQSPPTAPQTNERSYEATVNSQDYDVYDMSAVGPANAAAEAQPEAAAPQDQESVDDTDQAPMYFTSVNTDRSRRKVKRPVNPKEQAGSKGLLSKFFGKKEQDE